MSPVDLPRHPLLNTLPAALREHIRHMSQLETIPRGGYLLREGDDANASYLILEGRVLLEVHMTGAGAVPIETVETGGTVGWSWSIAPFKWHFDARALTETRVLKLDGIRLREVCDQDPALGYALLQRFMGVLQHRVESLRLQVLDIYQNRRDHDLAQALDGLLDDGQDDGQDDATEEDDDLAYD